jgi:hypothetical protein
MHDHVAVVDQHPAPFLEPLGADALDAGLFQLFHDRLRQRANVHAGGSRTDDERVGHERETGDVERDHVYGPLLVQGFQDQRQFLLRIHTVSFPDMARE